jgi:hypothetical protein
MAMIGTAMIAPVIHRRFLVIAGEHGTHMRKRA